MADLDDDILQPVWLDVQFPADARFAAAIEELAIRLAQLGGFGEADAGDIGQTTSAAVRGVLQPPRAEQASIDLSCRADERTFALTITSGGAALVSLKRPRPH
jgi:hypothetical protein